MKLFLVLTIFLSYAQPFTYGYLSEDITLYSDERCLEIVTSLPKTYFVIVLEQKETCCFVSYKDISGYAKNVTIVDYEPVNKYATASFSVNNDGYPAKLRLKPTDQSEVLTEIPPSASGYYYGDAVGKALIPQVGDVWRYVSYDDGTNTYRGYVYSSQTTVSEIQNNVIEKVALKEESEDNSSPSQNTDFVLISLLCIPSVVIMYLIFKDKERKPRYKE